MGSITRLSLIRLSGVLAIVIAVASCATATTSPVPANTVCDGITAEIGGCTTPRHRYTASTCVGLAKEWAGVVDPALVSVLDGPAAVNGNARSVRLQQALVIATLDMNTRLRELALQDRCDVPEFMAIVEPLFSERLRTGIAEALFDGEPATYDDWLGDVRRQLRVIDDGEAVPDGVSTSPPAP